MYSLVPDCVVGGIALDCGMAGILSNNIMKEEGQVQSILDIQFPENGAKVCLDGSFGYIKFLRNGLVVAALLHHSRNLEFPRRKAFYRTVTCGGITISRG